jgi:hypothetical protein
MAARRSCPAYAKAVEIAQEYGFSTRYWIKLAANGRIPGAKQPAGKGGCWVFDRVVFRRWWNSQGRRVSSWPGYTSAERRGGVASRGMAKNSGSPSKRDLKASLASVLGNGSTG